jgi:hypothetical protein
MSEDRTKQVDQAEKDLQRRVDAEAAAAQKARRAEEERVRKARDAQDAATVRYARSPVRSRSSSARRAGR